MSDDPFLIPGRHGPERLRQKRGRGRFLQDSAIRAQKRGRAKKGDGDGFCKILQFDLRFVQVEPP
jgi:hypothetical protein